MREKGELILAARKEYLTSIKDIMDHYDVPRDVAGLILAEAGQAIPTMIAP